MFVSQKMGFSDLHSQSVSFYPRVLFLPKLDEPVTELSAVQILLDVQVDIFKMFGAQHFFRDVNVLQMDYSFIYKCKDLSFDHFFLVVYLQIFLFSFGRLVQAFMVGICRPVGVLYPCFFYYLFRRDFVCSILCSSPQKK